LTAAHCIENVTSPNALTVVHGSNYWPNGTHAKVSKFISHENYENRTFNNDVALLKLAIPLVFNRFTNFVGLRKNPVPTGATAVISGFGYISTGGPGSKLLKYGNLTVIS
jgi:trypsin